MLMFITFIISFIAFINIYEAIKDNPLNNDISSDIDLPICKNNDHIVGTWIKRTSEQLKVAKKSSICCSWDKNDYLKNTHICGKTKTHGIEIYAISYYSSLIKLIR